MVPYQKFENYLAALGKVVFVGHVECGVEVTQGSGQVLAVEVHGSHKAVQVGYERPPVRHLGPEDVALISIIINLRTLYSSRGNQLKLTFLISVYNVL